MSELALQRQQLAELSQCAYRLGMAFMAEAEREGTTERGVEWFERFDRCFSGFRIAVALNLRLRKLHDAPEARTDREDLDTRAEREPSERDRGPDLRERDRDRETERASLPLLLQTLTGVCADAAALPGPESAELPTLRELLARIQSSPAPAAQAPKPATTPGLRARLTGSGAAPMVLTRPPPPKPGAAIPPRRATGPPRR